MNKTAQIIIIGGGVVGCATAYYLAKAGCKNVVVLEASKSIGHGGSSRNGGGVRQSGRDVRELPYAIYGIRHLWPTLSEELGVDVEYTQKGNLRLGKTKQHLEKLKTLADNAKKAGLGVDMVDAKEVQELCPYLAKDIIGASWCPTDGHANPLTTVLGYYRRSLELGVKFYTDAQVYELKKIKGKVRQVRLKDGSIMEGEQIILAAGYESRAIAKTVGVDLPMTRLIDEMLVTEMQPRMFDIMLGTADADFYGHQAAHGSFVFGSECGYEEVTDMEDPSKMITNSMTLSASCRAIMNYVPVLSGAKVVRSWCGWLDMSFDGVPFIGKCTDADGLIVACGFTGHGFGTAPSVGLMLSQMALGQKTIVDLQALSPDRFMPNR